MGQQEHGRMTERIHRLPILVISAHNRCNCRCGMCGIWRNTDARSFTLDDLRRQLPSIRQLDVEWVVFTGGEALMNRDLFEMAKELRAARIRVTLLTSGLLLERYAECIVTQMDEVIVSLDGPREIHNRIRGVAGAFEELERGVRALRRLTPAFPIRARCTIQRANHHALLETARAAQSLALDSLSFLAVDAGSDAFNHQPGLLLQRAEALLLTPSETDRLETEIGRLFDDPASKSVVESREKLLRIARHFRALAGECAPVAPLCNAPWISAVVEPNGDVRPCFFLPPIGSIATQCLSEAINSESALRFRESLDVPSNPVCRTCVCSLYRPVQVGAR
jgi:Fe-coproporphyrin III synthase